MNADPVKNISASVKNRLLSAARQSGKPFQSLLTHYGLERFLFRLSRSPLKEKFILKGGLLLVGMGLPTARTTRDIDFLGLIPGDIDAVSTLIREIGSAAIDDGLVYEFNDLSIEAMAVNAEYPGIRLKFDAWLGKARIPMQIDVGFGGANGLQALLPVENPEWPLIKKGTLDADPGTLRVVFADDLHDPAYDKKGISDHSKMRGGNLLHPAPLRGGVEECLGATPAGSILHDSSIFHQIVAFQQTLKVPYWVKITLDDWEFSL